MSQAGLIYDFWSDPVAGFKSLFTPSTPVTPDSGDAGGPISSFRALFGDGGDSLSSAQIRAYGVNPSTGGLIAPQYGPSATASGYSASDPQGFMAMITDQVQGQYNADYQSSYDAQSLFPSVSLPGIGEISGGWIVLVIVVVLAFFLLKAVK
jgi:hypothetical protein